jgi:FG-GAP repeat protein
MRRNLKIPWIVVRIGFTVVVVATGLARASAQERIYKWWGDQTNEYFGGQVATSVDLTGDGIPDFLVNASYSTDHGFLRAFSGSDGSTAWTLYGNTGEYLGFSFTTLGDVDQDGVGDFLATSVSPPFGNPNGYGITLYSGATRSPIYTILGDTNEQLGAGLASVGDVDLDGTGDFAAAENYYGGHDVHVFSGKTGTVIYLISPPSDSRHFGWDLSGGGDADGDGFDDLVISDPYAVQGGKSFGAAWVYSGKSGTLLQELKGVVQDSLFGYSVALIHDVDQDGLADVVVGAPMESVGTQDTGHVRVYSGILGTLLLDVSVPPFFTGDDIQFGQYVADAGDVNHDGYGDFFALQPWGGEFYDPFSYDAVVRLFSGRDGGQIYHYFDPQDHYFGVGPGSTTLVPDLDGDGNSEVAFGSWNDDDGSLTHPGSASVWRTDDLFVDVTPRQASSYDTIDVAIGQGIAGAPFVLFLVAVNGIPTTTLVAAGLFDATGRGTLTGTVPLGLAGYDFGLEAFTLNSRPKVIDSGVETLSIR